ncbi:MAG: hypothetical protein U9O98_09725 [Asgard group archaeon]|nr:hypothetical protein [Asgard group archaeon]
MNIFLKKTRIKLEQLFCLVTISLLLLSSFRGLANNLLLQSNASALNLVKSNNNTNEKDNTAYCYFSTFKGNKLTISLSDMTSKHRFGEKIQDSKWTSGNIPGAPSLPLRKYRLLLPPNIKPNDIDYEIIEHSSRTMLGEYKVSPGIYPVANSKEKSIISKTNDQSYIYQQDCFWPKTIIKSFTINQMRDAIIVEFFFILISIILSQKQS